MTGVLNELNQQHYNFRLSFLLTESNNNQGRLVVDTFAELIGDATGKTIFTCSPSDCSAIR